MEMSRGQAPGGRRGRIIPVALLGVLVTAGAVVATTHALTAPGRGSARVELLVYSGQPNPSFDLTRGEAEELAHRLDRLPPGAATPEAPGLGYSGLLVTFAGSDGRVDRATVYRGAVRLEAAGRAVTRTDAEGVERWLLDLGRQRGYSDVITSLGL